jgi:hypothetical protein
MTAYIGINPGVADQDGVACVMRASARLAVPVPELPEGRQAGAASALLR